MIIKKFHGKTESEAVNNARKELGPGAVIMNVKNTRKKGLFAFLRPQIVEVTVALEEESEKAVQPVVQVMPAQTPILQQSQDAGTARQAINSQILPEKPEKKESNVIEEKLDNLHILLEQQLQKPDEAKEPEEHVKEEANEMLVFIKLLYNTMIDNEVNEKYANQIIDEIEKNVKPNMPFDYALANTYQKMILKFGKPVVITAAQKGPKIVFFIGPTGVGKTTTIAKIASKFIVEDKKKVVLLTADTYRIAAAEQLRTYAGILETPFRVVYTEEEIQTCVTDFKDYEYIFIDTSGHSYQNENLKDDMRRIIHSVDGLAQSETFLVLSATTKYRDLLNIVDTYSSFTDYRLIFTKLDETEAVGNLLNIKLHTGAPLAYVTYGQNVPDDIEEFNPQKTVKQLLGGKK